MRILLAGDWHGNREWAATSLGVAARLGCDAVLQLGDFGLWPGREDAWLDHVDRLAGDAGVEVVWVDGNHEDHDALDRWREKADERGLVEMRERVRWASRGARWEWDGVRFGALGGAVSVDRFLRRRHVNWWPQESLSQTDVDRLGDEPLDVLATHSGPTTGALPLRPIRLPAGIVADARANRDLIDQAVARTSPRLVVHGHYHVRYCAEVDGRTVEGLAHDRSRDAEAEALAVLEPGAGLAVRPAR